METAEMVPTWPRIVAEAGEDGWGSVTVNGSVQTVQAASLEEVRIEIIGKVTETAIKLGRPVRVNTTGPDGEWPLIVHPDGTVAADEDELPAGRRNGSRNRGSSPTSARSAPSARPVTSPPTAPDESVPAAPEPAPSESLDDRQFDVATDAADDNEFPTSPDTPVSARPEPPVLPYVPAMPAEVHGEPVDPAANGQYADPVAGGQYSEPAVNGEYAEPAVNGQYAESVVNGQSVEPAVNGQYVEPAAGVPAWPDQQPYPANIEGRPPEQPDWPDTGFVPGFGQGGPQPYPEQQSNQQPIPADQPVTELQPDPYGQPMPPDQPAEPEARRSFLTQQRQEEPATRGFRGTLSRMGLRMSPNAAERAERDDRAVVSQHWPGPRTIAVVNGKGGASKTPTTALLAAVFARCGGGGVVAWDNNQTRGTLGWRTEQGPHDSTLLDLLPQVKQMCSVQARSADMARYVHHQGSDRYDVLRSKPMALAHEQRVLAADVDAIETVLDKYYRLIIVDSGNDESDPTWLRMIDLSDQIVVATTPRDDHAEAGALLLEALAQRDQHSAELARNAVVVVNQANPDTKPAELGRVATGYRNLARETVTIPFDQQMVDGLLRFDALRPATQRAWLAAGAAVARGL